MTSDEVMELGSFVCGGRVEADFSLDHEAYIGYVPRHRKHVFANIGHLQLVSIVSEKPSLRAPIRVVLVLSVGSIAILAALKHLDIQQICMFVSR